MENQVPLFYMADYRSILGFLMTINHPISSCSFSPRFYVFIRLVNQPMRLIYFLPPRLEFHHA